MNDFDLNSYNFDLPKSCIADRPEQARENCKLLVYNCESGTIEHKRFYQLPELLSDKDHLVLNNSKVYPARIFGTKNTGGNVEIFLLSLIDSDEGTFPCFIKASGKRKVGEVFYIADNSCEIISQDGKVFWVKFSLNKTDLIKLLNEKGLIPIPKYIRKGISDEQDKKDYQTVYAKNLGSVAAPTAGLHFTNELLSELDRKNINHSFVTLHVGAGTFAPIENENILDHKMHHEVFQYESEQLEHIKKHNKNIIAVGTTSLRALESSVDENGNWIINDDEMHSTDIFIYPGKPIHTIRGLITNFHLPKSSLLVLVSALVGREKALELYEVAIKNNYKFYSYGDAMLIQLRNQ